MGEPNHQGWYLDPFALHEARYFSDGKPTKLVRDDGVETYQEPPSSEWDGALVALDQGDATSVPSVAGNEQDPVDVIEAFIVSGRTAPKQRP